MPTSINDKEENHVPKSALDGKANKVIKVVFLWIVVIISTILFAVGVVLLIVSFLKVSLHA